VKVPLKVAFHSWAESYVNPAASNPDGMMMLADLSKFGRSEQLHYAFFGIHEFVIANKRYPTAADYQACVDLSKSTAEANKFEAEFDEKVFKNAVSYTSGAISPMCAFFGGIVA